MQFDHFPYQQTIRESYMRAEDFLVYLNDYANHFAINELIKFNHTVIRVRPIEETKWEVKWFCNLGL